MIRRPTRRSVLIGGVGALAAAGLTAGVPGFRRAWARESLTVVEWGGPYNDAMRKIVADYDKYDVTWELHAGGAAAILPKIKSQWPDNVRYDLVASYTPVTVSMVQEGWLETVTTKNVPNIADIPPSLITKDKDGNFKDIPRNTGSVYFGYRKDRSPIEIKTLEDLLNPKLKGQILWPDPVYASNIAMVLLALARGGDEFHMDPGWKFMKELAKSGNIGRVYKTESDFIASMSSGDTSVGAGANTNWANLARQFPIEHLTKVPNVPGLKTALYVEAWTVLKGKKSAEAFELANYTVSAKNNQAWAAAIGAAPSNLKAKATKDAMPVVFTEQQLKDSTYIPDWNYLGQQIDGSVKRFEQEIQPLFRG